MPNLMVKIFPLFFIAGLIHSACSNQAEPSASQSSENPSKSAVSLLLYESDPPDQLIRTEAPFDSDTLLVAILWKDSRLLPIAQYADDQWINPWSKPEDGVEPTLPGIHVPHMWHINSLEDSTYTVNIDHFGIGKIQCVQNWMFTTDLVAESEKTMKPSRELAGIAFSQQVNWLTPNTSFPALAHIDSIYKQLNLINKPVEGFGSAAYENLGYFEVDQSLFGVAKYVGWETDGYIIYEINGQKGRRHLDVFVGGC